MSLGDIASRMIEIFAEFAHLCANYVKDVERSVRGAEFAAEATRSTGGTKQHMVAEKL
jgi:hypothetical protein